MMEMAGKLRLVGIATLIVSYLMLVHYANLSMQGGVLAALLAVAPVFGLALALSWNSSTRLTGCALLAVSCIASWALWSPIRQHSGFIFWVQDVGLQLVLFVTFARSLRAGHKPLCVYFAEMLHGPLPPRQERYARRVTVAWVMFFAMMAIATTLLFFLAPLAVWSFFANFLVLPLTALMFIAEYLVRRRLLPDIPPGHILDAVRAYRNSSARAH